MIEFGLFPNLVTTRQIKVLAAPVPFQIDRAVRGFAMDFCPAMRTPRPLVFSGNQIKSPELRIGHDLFPQRSTPGRDDLNHRLHFSPRFSRKSLVLQCLFGLNPLSLQRHARAPHRGAATVNPQATSGT